MRCNLFRNEVSISSIDSSLSNTFVTFDELSYTSRISRADNEWFRGRGGERDASTYRRTWQRAIETSSTFLPLTQTKYCFQTIPVARVKKLMKMHRENTRLTEDSVMLMTAATVMTETLNGVDSVCVGVIYPGVSKSMLSTSCNSQ